MLRLLSRAAHAAGLAGCVCALWSAWAAGASLEVNPVRLTLSGARPVAALTVRNAGKEPAGVHLQLMAWTQNDAADGYAPTRDLLATPPIFTLAPGAAQTVRVGLRRPIDPNLELAYRLYIREIPDSAALEGAGVRIVLRIGVPVFVLPEVHVAPALRWRAQQTGKEVLLQVQNSGNAHARIVRLDVLAGTGASTAAGGAYVLAGQTWHWRLDFPARLPSGTRLQVRAKTESGDMNADVPLE